jgi:hypothetical protein
MKIILVRVQSGPAIKGLSAAMLCLKAIRS